MYIVHLGVSGFPWVNTATIQRIRLTFKALKEASANPIIINKKSTDRAGNKKHIGRYDGLIFINTSCNPSYPKSFIWSTLR